MGRRLGQDIFIGGINWDRPALEEVREGSLEVSVGGHFMTGGWALILLHDYHHGIDFIAEGVALQRQIFEVLSRDNIDTFWAEFGERDWSKVNFRSFSKVYNQHLQQYNFSAEALFE